MQQQKATLEVVNGEHPGSVKFIAKAEDKAAAYIWQYILATALTADGVWQVASITTGASATLDGLTSGSLYYFRVADRKHSLNSSVRNQLQLQLSL